MAHFIESVHNFEELIWELNLHLQQNEFGDKHIIDILMNCHIPKNEWSKYAFYDSSICCSRNMVYELSKKYRLVLNCWSPQKENRIHDHSNSDCYFKVLQGKVREKQYIDPQTLKIDNEYEVGDVRHLGYLPGLHSMENFDTSLVAVTLHVYVPPFDTYLAVEDGNSQEETLTFVSRFGFSNDRSIMRLP